MNERQRDPVGWCVRHHKTLVYDNDGYGLEELANRIDPRLIVDVGYNVGWFSKKASEVWPDARIIGIEPGDDLPNHGPVIPVHGALSPEPSVCLVPVARAPANLAARYVVPGDDVPGISREDLLQWGPVDLLKLDCEGAEHYFFEGPPDSWTHTWILGEVHGRAPGNFLLNSPWRDTHDVVITVQYGPRQFEFRMRPKAGPR